MNRFDAYILRSDDFEKTTDRETDLFTYRKYAWYTAIWSSILINQTFSGIMIVYTSQCKKLLQ